MTVSFLAQGPIFVLAVASIVVLLRLLPRLRVRGLRIRWWLVALAAIGALTAPTAIAILGHGASEDESLWEAYYDWPAVCFSAAATFVLATAVALGWISRRFDPARGRRRCPKCWYDMQGSPTHTCPECGRTPRTERGLLRTRPSRRLFFASLGVLVLSYGVLKTPQVSEDGWGMLIPSTPMIVAIPYVPTDWLTRDDDSTWALDDRSVSNLWPWQEELLMWRADRIIARSTDLNVLARAAPFADDAKLSDAAMVKVILAQLGGTEVVSVLGETGSAWATCPKRFGVGIRRTPSCRRFGTPSARATSVEREKVRCMARTRRRTRARSPT